MELSGQWLEKALLELCNKIENGLDLDAEIISGLVSYCELAPPLEAKEYLDVTFFPSSIYSFCDVDFLAFNFVFWQSGFWIKLKVRNWELGFIIDYRLYSLTFENQRGSFVRCKRIMCLTLYFDPSVTYWKPDWISCGNFPLCSSCYLSFLFLVLFSLIAWFQ